MRTATLGRWALLLALTVVAAPASAEIFYSAILNPRQEAPPVASSAMGGGRFIIDTQANTVTYWISYAGLSSAEQSAHIHQGAPGANGAIKHDLPVGNPKVGQWNYAEIDEAAILNGQMYANIHTASFVNGELRGQIVALNALLGANQEVPPNASAGRGWAIATVDTALNQLSYRVFYEGLSGAVSQAHFHGNALHGANASPKATLTVTASPMAGTVVYNPLDEAAVLAGRWYVNLHTSAHPGGEIRGQMVSRVVPMDALQESPVNANLGSAGFALVAIDTAANVLSHDVRVIALSSAETAAHIHGFASLGSNASPLANLALGSPKIGQWLYGAVSEQNVLLGGSYINVHTNIVPDGEIRGQILGLAGADALVSVGSGKPQIGIELTAAPNPSADRTRLTFQLAREGHASLAIVGVDGRRVRVLTSGTLAAGPYSFDWDGQDDAGRGVAPGIYFAIARTSSGEQVTRLVRLN